MYSAVIAKITQAIINDKVHMNCAFNKITCGLPNNNSMVLHIKLAKNNGKVTIQRKRSVNWCLWDIHSQNVQYSSKSIKTTNIN